MNKILSIKDITDSIGYCGLVCKFCHEADKCDGCKSNKNCCSRRFTEDGCYQYDCCVKKGIQGCWECDIDICEKDMFSNKHDIRNRTFVKCAKYEGIEKLAEYVLQNQENGIKYGWNKNYDNLDSEEAILDLLHNGMKSKYVKGDIQNISNKI